MRQFCIGTKGQVNIPWVSGESAYYAISYSGLLPGRVRLSNSLGVWRRVIWRKHRVRIYATNRQYLEKWQLLTGSILVEQGTRKWRYDALSIYIYRSLRYICTLAHVFRIVAPVHTERTFTLRNKILKHPSFTRECLTGSYTFKASTENYPLLQSGMNSTGVKSFRRRP